MSAPTDQTPDQVADLNIVVELDLDTSGLDATARNELIQEMHDLLGSESLPTEEAESGVPLIVNSELERLRLSIGQEAGTQEQDPTSVQPLLSSIRDLRSALHERVLNLGDEVERLRARASAVQAVQQRSTEIGLPLGRTDFEATVQDHIRLGEIAAERNELRVRRDNAFAARRQAYDRPAGEEERFAARRQAYERPVGEGEGEGGATPEDPDPVGMVPGPWSFLTASERLLANLPRTRDRPVQVGLDDNDPARVPAPWRVVGQGINGLSSGSDLARDRDRQEGKYEIVKGSGSKEIEGSKEERRQKRLHQVKLENTRLESKASVDDIRRRVASLSTRAADTPSSETTPGISATSSPGVSAVLTDILQRSRLYAIPPSAPATTDQSLTTRGIRVQNAQNGSTAADARAEVDRRYRNALMNRPVPPANTDTASRQSTDARVDRNVPSLLTTEMEQNIARLQRMVQDARALQDRQLQAGTDPIDVRGGQELLNRARENVQELRSLHTTLEGLYTRYDAARQTLDSAPAPRPRALPSNTPAPRSRPRSSATPRPTTARRPSPPFLRSSTHPYFRPRIGVEPIAAVLNIDNLNSFELHFDGSVVFRPIARRSLDDELVARCLSMLPGGREDTPSRWMRQISETSSRPRRAEAWGGYWIRWVSEELFEVEAPRQRRLDTDSMPKIIAFDIAVTPPEDDAWVRSDESEFYTPRTRLRRHIGPWIHSRIRIAPYETDPAGSPWGTSAHVRQAIRTVGRVRTGDFVRFKLDERVVTLVRAPSSSSTPAAAVPADTRWRDLEDLDTSSSTAWLNVYQPALQQITTYWQSHHRRVTNGETSPPPLLLEAEEMAGGWGRDYLDANGVPLPTATLARLTELTNSLR